MVRACFASRGDAPGRPPSDTVRTRRQADPDPDRSLPIRSGSGNGGVRNTSRRREGIPKGARSGDRMTAGTALQRDTYRDDFAALLEESFLQHEITEGSVVKGSVVAIEKDVAVIDVGLKTEGRVALKEFAGPGRERRARRSATRSRSISTASRTRSARPSSRATRRAARRAGSSSRRPSRPTSSVEGIDLQPGQGRLHRRSRRRRGVPAALARSTSARSATSTR